MNHSLACAYDSSTFSPLAILFNSGPCRCSPLTRCLSTIAASPATVGCSNISLNPISTPNDSLILDTTCVASSECPPISKKFSSTPTDSLLSTSPHIPLTISSTAVCSRRSPSTCSASGAGRALRSSFPFAVSGILSTFTILPGTMYSGILSLSPLFISSILASPSSSSTTYPTKCCPIPSSSLTNTAACFTPACSLITASTSPNSTL